MKKHILLTLCTIMISVSISCHKIAIQEALPLSLSDLSKPEIEALYKAGIPSNNAIKKQLIHPDDSAALRIVADDTSLDPQKLIQGTYAMDHKTDSISYYQRNNLVHNAHTTIHVLGYTGACCVLASKMQTGLKWAVQNYNRLHTRLHFTLTFGTDTEQADIIIYNNGGSALSGIADVPSNGEPGKYIRLDGGLAHSTININEHVITHLIGHAIGLGHTDSLPHSKSNQNKENDLTGFEVNHLSEDSLTKKNHLYNPNTASIMTPGYKSSTDGEFSDLDKELLRFLYKN